MPRDRWVHPHSLRHFSGTEAVRKGMPLDHVRRLLGHASLNTTLIYTHLVEADVAAAHEKADVIGGLLGEGDDAS